MNATDKKEFMNKVEYVLQRSVYNTKTLLAKALDISRPTLDSRLSGKTEWKRLEVFYINHVYSKLEK